MATTFTLETLKYWVGVQQGQSYLMGRRCLFSFGWPPMASLGCIGPPKFRFPLDIKAPGPALIFLVGISPISDPHINICVGPHNTCVALKQFNLLPTNTLFWSNFIYYPQTHRFEAVTLGWIKTCVKWFWDNFDWDWKIWLSHS